MILQLTNETVTLKDQLTWGDNQKIKSVITQSAKLSGRANDAENLEINLDASTVLESKYVAVECAIEKIEREGKQVSYSRNWLNNLSVDDGDKLIETVDSLYSKK